VRFEVTVPPGALAKVVLPAGSRMVEASGKVGGVQEGQIGFEVGEGTWHFVGGPEGVRLGLLPR